MTYEVSIYDRILHSHKTLMFSTFEESVIFVEQFNKESDSHIKAQLVPFCD